MLVRLTSLWFQDDLTWFSNSIAAVHNIKTVAHCVAKSFTFLRSAGLSPEKTTCVGHSLGLVATKLSLANCFIIFGLVPTSAV